MRKFFAIAAFLLMTVAANAQFNFGVKGGLNLTTFSLDKSSLETSNQTGYFIGPSVKFTLPVIGLGFDLSALYNVQKGEIAGKVDDVDDVATIKNQSISIPLNVRYQIIGIGDLASIYAFAGPQIDFNLGDKDITFKNVLNDTFEGAAKNDWSLNNTQFSINLGVGVMALKHIQVSANYNIGLGSTGEMGKKADALGGNAIDKAGALWEFQNSISGSTAKSWQVSATYFF